MNFHHHIPAAPLCHFISMMWFGDDYIVPHSLERVLPTGEISLIINLWENRTRVYDRDDPREFTTCDGCIVAGAYSAFTVIDTDEQRATAGVVFRPGGAFPFLGLPAAKLQDTSASLADLWGRQAASELREQLLAAHTASAEIHKFSSVRCSAGSRRRPSRRILPSRSPSKIFATGRSGRFLRSPIRSE